MKKIFGLALIATLLSPMACTKHEEEAPATEQVAPPVTEQAAPVGEAVPPPAEPAAAEPAHESH